MPLRSAVVSKIESWTGRLAGSLERRGTLCAAVFSCLYLILFFWYAGRRALWYDELITYYLVRQPSISGMWRALLAGFDQIPFGLHLLTRPFLSLSLDPRLELRFPPILGVLLLMLSLYRFVGRRLGALYGLIAMLVPLSSAIAMYALEARAYALVLGFGALAACFWQSASERAGRPRWGSLGGLTLSFAAAIACHYYALALLVPFGLAEALRAIRTRKIDWAVAGAFALSLAVLIPLWPHLSANLRYPKYYWQHANIMSITGFYRFFFTPGMIPLMALGAICVAYRVWGAPQAAQPRLTDRMPLHELVFAAACALIAVLVVIVALVITGAYYDRYALHSGIGLAILVPCGIYVLAPSRGVALAGVAILASLGWVAVNTASMLDAHPASGLVRALAKADPDPNLPVMITSGLSMLEIYYDSPPQVAGRVAYFVDPVRARRILGATSIDSNLEMARPFVPFHLLPFADYARNPRPLLVFDPTPSPGNWLVYELLERHWKLQLLAVTSGRLFRADPPEAASSQAAR